MQEIKVKTHLIITDIHNEYHINWCGKFIDAKPLLNERGLPKFIIIGSKNRVEINTTDMAHLERLCKQISCPKGRSAVSKDMARIYIKEIDGNEKLMGVFTHRRVKEFAPMYDTMGYR